MDAIRGFGIFLFVVLLILGVIEWIGKRIASRAGVQFDGLEAFRRSIIFIGELAAILLVISLTIVGAIMGAASSTFTAYTLSSLGVNFGRDSNIPFILSVILGGCGGFLSGAFATSFLFVVSSIERNTRRSALYLQALESKRS